MPRYLCIIILSLLDHVELPVLSWIVADSSTIQPVAIVTAHIVINLKRHNDHGVGFSLDFGGAGDRLETRPH